MQMLCESYFSVTIRLVLCRFLTYKKQPDSFSSHQILLLWPILFPRSTARTSASAASRSSSTCAAPSGSLSSLCWRRCRSSSRPRSAWRSSSNRTTSGRSRRPTSAAQSSPLRSDFCCLNGKCVFILYHRGSFEFKCYWQHHDSLAQPHSRSALQHFLSKSQQKFFKFGLNLSVSWISWESGVQTSRDLMMSQECLWGILKNVFRHKE